MNIQQDKSLNIYHLHICTGISYLTSAFYAFMSLKIIIRDGDYLPVFQLLHTWKQKLRIESTCKHMNVRNKKLSTKKFVLNFYYFELFIHLKSNTWHATYTYLGDQNCIRQLSSIARRLVNDKRNPASKHTM